MATLTRIRSAVIRGLKADRIVTTPRGWTANLAIFRIVYLCFGALPCALKFLSWTQKILPGISPEMWHPISFYHLLPISLLGNIEFDRLLAVADVLFIVLGIVGFWTRLSIGLATLVSLYGFGLMQDLGEVNHFHHTIWFMALLAAGPSGSLLSIDALIQGMKTAATGNIEAAFRSSAALWTHRYTWLLMGALYVGTGIAKLQSSLTNHWLSSANLRNIMWKKWLEVYWYQPHFGWLIRADSLPAWILVILGAGTVAFELGFIFAVFFRRARPFLALWGLAFHLGNLLVLKIWFTTLMAAYVSLIDWTAARRFLSSLVRDPLLVFYDDGCGRCRRTVAILRSLDLFDALEPVAGSDPRRRAYPQITDEMLAGDLCVVAAGRRAAGYDAYAWIAESVLLLWPIAAIMRFRPISALGRRVYRPVAGSRHCPLAAPKTKQRAATRRSEFALVHGLGPLLFACQMGVSSLMLLHTYAFLPANVPHLGIARRLVNGVGKRQPVWPFDLYPTFTPPTGSVVEVWEARWVTSSGREILVSPIAYDHAFANSPLTLAITSDEMLRRTDPEQDQTRSLNLIRLLLRREPPEIQRNIRAVNIYRAEYKLQAPSDRFPAALVAQAILYTFPRSRIDETILSDVQ
jgi:predicted DCC family thiol-disulfide oxidoreductase YuxK